MPHLAEFSPDSVPYVSVVKVAIVLLILLGWAAAAQWIDRDTDVVKTKREQWNVIVLSGGLVATFVLFGVPIWSGGLFVLGVAVWALLAGGAMLAYVVHRNGRVSATAQVLTLGHAKRLVGGGGGRKAVDKGRRVRLADHKGNPVEFPRDRAEAEAFMAVEDFLHDLLWRRASDAELIPTKEKYRFVYRVDGIATEESAGMPLEEGERIVRLLKKHAGLNVEEIRRPQSGKIQVALLSHEGEMGKSAVETSGTTVGERLRIRMQAAPKVFRLHELGIAAPRVEKIKELLGKKVGLFLLSAPPEHGLTTTQYAILKSHDAYMNNIHALERRPLVELDNITQNRYEGANTDVNYARMLQTVLRREPDMVLVGECEDRETALIATRAAADDRKIYMGMDAKDTFDALGKYLTHVNDAKLAAKALIGVMNQRLVRILCTECREAFQPDPATLKKLNLPADKIQHFYRPPSEPKLDRKGKPVVCTNCQGTGYVGRVGVFELLLLDPSVAKLLEENVPMDRVKALCRKSRMLYLQEEALLKVIDGTTSMNEVLRCLRGNEK